MKYKIARNVLSEDFLKTAYQYCLSRNNDGCLNDGQAPGCPSFYNDSFMKMILTKMLPTMEKTFKLKLYPTYCYWRLYKKGVTLKRHTDRPACEISGTINIGKQGKIWPVYLEVNGKVKKVMLEPGDMLCYRGCEVPHWREQLETADNYAQLFIHYVDKNGSNSWCKDDLKRL